MFAPSRSFPLAERLSRAAAHLILFGAVFFSAARFLEWDLAHPGRGLIAFATTGALVVVMPAVAAGRSKWVSVILLCLVPGAALLLVALVGGSPRLVHTTYILGMSLALVCGCGFLRKRLDQAGAWPGAEDLRLASLVLLAVWQFQPYLTSQFFGGIDARSYAYGMADALSQARAGVFPVFVGQTEFMFEGVIHPIRTAPYHHHLGMLLDLLTLRTLTPVAVQHLTVVVTGAMAAVVCYGCLRLLEPKCRWLAWAFAVLYVTAPAVTGFIFGQEMYMTFMAFAWLPMVMLGNIRLMRRDDRRGWAILAAGLALVWFCHAPVGTWLTLCTVMLQGLRLLGRDREVAAWRRALGGAVLFAALTAYYFWSVTEVALTRQRIVPSPGAGGWVFVILGCGLATVVRYVATSNRWWLGLAAIATVVLWFDFRAYALWLAAMIGCAGLWMVVTAVKPTWRQSARVPEISVLFFLLAGLAVLPWTGPENSVPSLGYVQQLFPKNWRPVSERASALSDIQIGYPLTAACLIGLIAMFRTKRVEVRLLALATVVGLMLLVPVPGVTRALLSHVPNPLLAISSLSLWLRYVPTLVALGVFVGFLSLAEWTVRFPRTGVIITVLSFLALPWSLFEGTKFVNNGYRAMKTTGEHLDFNRRENISRFAYVFPGMPISPYLVNGVVDYHLESRLLRVDDPNVELGETVPWSASQWQTLVAAVDTNNPSWINLTPTLTLAPGERRLLRFRFFDRPYNGVLIMRGPAGWYRQYQLPEAGFTFAHKSFGVSPERPKTLALWNSSDRPQSVELVFLRYETPADGKTPADFAELAMLSYDPARLPIRTEALIPYRARVTLTEPAYLETLRTFIPGYRAMVNGKLSPAERSPNHRVMLRLEPGENRVELRYVGTKALWLALGVSSLTWLGLVGTGVRSLIKSRARSEVGKA